MIYKKVNSFISLLNMGEGVEPPESWVELFKEINNIFPE